MSPWLQVALVSLIVCYTFAYLLFVAWVSDPDASHQPPPWANLLRQAAVLLLLVAPLILAARFLLRT
jgi:hypothetical protein